MFVDKFEKTVSKGFMDLISENTVTFFKVLYDENDDLNTLTSYLLLYKREGKLYYDELNIEVDEDFSIYDTFTEWSYPPYQKVTEELKDYKSAFEYSKAMYQELFNK